MIKRKSPPLKSNRPKHLGLNNGWNSNLARWEKPICLRKLFCQVWIILFRGSIPPKLSAPYASWIKWPAPSHSRIPRPA